MFTKMIVNISDKSVSMIDNNTCIRLIHKNDDLFSQWILVVILIQGLTDFDMLRILLNSTIFFLNIDDVFHIQF